MPGFNGKTHTMPQFSHLKGGPKSLPADVPINYIDAGGATASSSARGDTKSMPKTPSTVARKMRQDTGTKKGAY